MTKEEAIYELDVNVDYKTKRIKEACQLAIEALEEQKSTKLKLLALFNYINDHKLAVSPDETTPKSDVLYRQGMAVALQDVLDSFEYLKLVEVQNDE